MTVVPQNLKPEEEARKLIDELLEKAGWTIQDSNKLDLSESEGDGNGVMIKELQLGQRPADYVIILDRKAVGVIEAKKFGTTLSSVADQSMDYLNLIPEHLSVDKKPIFHYESTGIKTKFRNLKDPIKRSRTVFAFHKPDTLRKWFAEEKSLRKRLQELPELNTKELRKCQIEAITNLENSFALSNDKSLIQMAPGSGKTYTAVSFVYRLLKFAKAKKVLFLVDRNTLGKQALVEFEKYKTPDDGRKFKDLYNPQRLQTNELDPSSDVVITTIQRLFSMLKGEKKFEGDEEKTKFEDSEEGEEIPISFNEKFPIETFDFIITDECHRSIYGLWNQVLEYFDSMIIGLTATPNAHTFSYFDQNLVMEYDHARAVADRVNVGFDIYKIYTDVSESGGKIDSRYVVQKRDKQTQETRWSKLDEDFEYGKTDLDRSVVVPSQITTIIQEFKRKLFTEIFPGRTKVPKTLIFAKTDSHAEDIVEIVRKVFNEGNEFCKKVTYTSGTKNKPDDKEKPETIISQFRNEYYPRIAVTVDLIATGTDIRPLECVMFMRDVNSRTYFEQMVGRGSRTITPTEFQKVSIDAKKKDHFVLVDCVGVTEHNKIESKPLERNRATSFKKLVEEIGRDNRDEDIISSVAGRLARLDNKIDNEDREKIKQAAEGLTINEIINGLLNSMDPDVTSKKAQEMFKVKEPSKSQLEDASKDLVKNACKPFDKPEFRDAIVQIHTNSYQIIDVDTIDRVIESEFDSERSQTLVTDFKKFIENNKDKIDALQIIYNLPYKKRKVTYDQIKELAKAMTQIPSNPTPDILWHAYTRLEKDRVRGASSTKQLVDLVALVRFAIKQTDVLEEFSVSVNERFQKWLDKKKKAGYTFTPVQEEWLEIIKEHVSTSVSMDKDDFQLTPFIERGGLMKFYEIFGDDHEKLLQELNEALISA